jgi:HPt (histidine-containing phosphotransfer) domain-containing protein
MDDFVTKPFRADELYRAVESVSPSEQRLKIEAAPAMSDEDELCLDWQGALRKLEGDEELLIELSEMFLDQCPTLMAAVEDSIVKEEAAELRRAAHTLKGSAHVVGGRAVGAAALLLENIGRDTQLEAAAAALGVLKEKVSELKPALQAAMQGRAAATGG